MSEDKVAMILAAGLGTRLGSVTDDTPKALVTIHGVPLLEIVIRRLIRAGFQDMVVNVHHHAEKITDFLLQKEYFGVRILVSEEQPEPLETGGALRYARHLLEPYSWILVHNVDVLTDLPLDHFLKEARQEKMPAMLSVRRRKASRYLLADERLLLCGWEDAEGKNRKIVRDPEGDLQRFGFSGIQVLRRDVLDSMPDQEVFSLTAFYLDLARDKRVKLLPHEEGFWYDIGKPDTLKRATEEVTYSNLQRLIR